MTQGKFYRLIFPNYGIMTDFEQIEFKKWTIRKMILYTLGIVSTCVTVGWQGSQLKTWHDNTDTRLTKVEQWQASKDREEHEQAMKKIYSCTYPYFHLKDLGICNSDEYLLLATNP